MNELDPDLKRLLKWARRASPSRPEAAPFGFSGRVLAGTREVQAPTLLQELQENAWGLTWVSLALIVCGGLMLASERSAPSTPAAELPPALSFVASSITP